MATITVKNVPDDVYEKLKAMAKEHRRSINNEVIVLIEDHVGKRRLSTEEMLAQAREVRKLTAGVTITDEELDEWINSGRP